jgi:hypothetical protein
MVDGDSLNEPSPVSGLSQMAGSSCSHATLGVDGNLTVTLTATPSAFDRQLHIFFCKDAMERTIHTCPLQTVTVCHRHLKKF